MNKFGEMKMQPSLEKAEDQKGFELTTAMCCAVYSFFQDRGTIASTGEGRRKHQLVKEGRFDNL